MIHVDWIRVYYGHWLVSSEIRSLWYREPGSIGSDGRLAGWAEEVESCDLGGDLWGLGYTETPGWRGHQLEKGPASCPEGRGIQVIPGRISPRDPLTKARLIPGYQSHLTCQQPGVGNMSTLDAFPWMLQLPHPFPPPGFEDDEMGGLTLERKRPWEGGIPRLSSELTHKAIPYSSAMTINLSSATFNCLFSKPADFPMSTMGVVPSSLPQKRRGGPKFSPYSSLSSLLLYTV